jgi:hypothetical protein
MSSTYEGKFIKTGTIDGKTLKSGRASKYFKHCKIDEDIRYRIDVELPRTLERKEGKGWIAIKFRIPELSETTYPEGKYNKLSPFAFEFSKIEWDDCMCGTNHPKPKNNLKY